MSIFIILKEESLMDKKIFDYLTKQCGMSMVEFRIPVHSSMTDDEWEYGISRKLRPLGWSVTLPGISASSEFQYAPTAIKTMFGTKESLYLHPQEIEGWATESSRDSVLSLLEEWEDVSVVRDLHFNPEQVRGLAVRDGKAFVEANRFIFAKEAANFFDIFRPKMAAEFANSFPFRFTDWSGNPRKGVGFAEAIEGLCLGLVEKGYLKEVEPLYKPQVRICGETPRYFVRTRKQFQSMTEGELSIRTAIAKVCRHAADEKRLEPFFNGFPYLNSLDWEIKAMGYGDFDEGMVQRVSAEMLDEGVLCNAYPKALNRKVERVTLAEF